MENFKEKINLLFAEDIKDGLINGGDKYIIKNFSDEEYFIKPEPMVLKGNLKELYPFICYDFDSLPIEMQEKYKLNYKTFEQIDGNLYKMITKKYEFSRTKKK